MEKDNGVLERKFDLDTGVTLKGHILLVLSLLSPGSITYIEHFFIPGTILYPRNYFVCSVDLSYINVYPSVPIPFIPYQSWGPDCCDSLPIVRSGLWRSFPLLKLLDSSGRNLSLPTEGGFLDT